MLVRDCTLQYDVAMRSLIPKRSLRPLLVFAALVFAPRAATAHFLLLSPESWIFEGEYGDPQHTSPCGDDGSATPTGTITPFAPGETITITIDEKIYHPGHYRVALAVNRADLPAPPPVTADGFDDCGSVPIMDPPVFPVLADGVFMHSAPFSGPQSIQVTLPSDVTCTSCTLQLIEFTHNHGAPCWEYHCADISIVEPPPGCTSNDECADQDQCTVDACDTETGDCAHVPGDGSACDDGSVCTNDGCDPAQGCVHVTVALADGSAALLGGIEVAECEAVPPAILGAFEKAKGFLDKGAATPAKARRFLKRAGKQLRKAAKKTTRAGGRSISAECATALHVVLGPAQERVQCMLSTP